MNRAIVYTSKHGFTKMCANYLKDKMDDAILYEMGNEIDLNGINHVIVGAYIKEGKIAKEAQKFFDQFKGKLLKAKLDIFCSGLDKGDYENAIQTSIHPELFYHAKIVCPGGEIKMDKLSFFEKRTIKKRIGIEEDKYEFYPERLDALIK